MSSSDIEVILYTVTANNPEWIALFSSEYTQDMNPTSVNNNLFQYRGWATFLA